MHFANLRLPFISLVAILLSLFVFTPDATADVRLESQIISSNTVWDDSSRNYILEGKIQVPIGVTLTISPGVSLDATKGEFVVLGNLIIGSSTGPKVKVKVGSFFLNNKSNPTSVSIVNSEFTGRLNSKISLEGGTELLFGGQNISILNSVFYEIFILISCDRKPSTYVLDGNLFVNVSHIFLYNDAVATTVTNNAFYNLFSLAYNGSMFGTRNSSLNISSNYFVNKELRMYVVSAPTNAKESPTGKFYSPYKFSDNYFLTPEMISFGTKGTHLENNYWNGLTESQVREFGHINDGRVDITLPVVNFTPTLNIAPSKSDAALKLDSLIVETEREAAEKAAAEKAAAEKAAAEKAAAEKAAAEKAAAEKAAAEKAAAEKAAASKKTIQCQKGKVIKKFTGVTPKCPAGFKKK